MREGLEWKAAIRLTRVLDDEASLDAPKSAESSTRAECVTCSVHEARQSARACEAHIFRLTAFAPPDKTKEYLLTLALHFLNSSRTDAYTSYHLVDEALFRRSDVIHQFAQDRSDILGVCQKSKDLQLEGPDVWWLTSCCRW